MPIKKTTTKRATKENQVTMLNLSWEHQLAAWLLRDGWEVFMPLTDVGQKTDIAISDGTRFYRIQVKTVISDTFSTKLKNSWGGKDPLCDIVLIILKGCGQGICLDPLKNKSSEINLSTAIGERFKQDYKNFIAAFKSCEIG